VTRVARAVVAACAAAWWAVSPLHATVIVGADLGEVARAARIVARGRVVATEGRWTADRRTIETLVTLDVEAYLKGELAGLVSFTVPGGRLGRYRSIVIGAPRFDVGERVVVFLDARGPSLPFVVGLGQGVYRIVASSDGTSVVTPPVPGPATTTSSRTVRGDPGRRPMAVDAFDALVRQLAERRP